MTEKPSQEALDEAVNAGLNLTFRNRSATFAIVFEAKTQNDAVSSSLLDDFEYEKTSYIGLVDGLVIDGQNIAFDASVDQGVWHGEEIFFGVSPAFSDFRDFAEAARLPQNSLILSIVGGLTIAGVRELFPIAEKLGGTCYCIDETQKNFAPLKDAAEMVALTKRKIFELIEKEGVTSSMVRLLLQDTAPSS